MSRCAGLSWNAWLYFTPGHVLQSLVERRFLRSCSNHKTKLVLTSEGRDWLESGYIMTKDSTRKEQANGQEN